ncbi:MAG: 50S ribosomal protein L32e [Methanoregula sp.]|nr:50S ribosomal protein L32e [Methanoregula sp.]
MTTEIKRLIRVRVAKGAAFKRDGYGKKRQLSDSWRKPKGQHNKQREQKKAKGALPKPGYGSPIAVRGMHPSGFFEVLVATATELAGLDPKTQAVRISGTVGDRKRIGLQAAAIAAGLKVLNARTVKSVSDKENAIPAKKSATPKKETKKPVKADASAKKGAKKATDAAPEAKKAPVKDAKKAAKPKAEKAPEVKAASKPAKPKAEKSPEPAAKQSAASKPKATKKTGSEVKKNE